MVTSTTGSILKRLGLIGPSGSAVGSLTPQPATPQADQVLHKQFIDSGAISDPDIWSRYNNAMKRPVSFEAMLNLWEEMSSWDLARAALTEMVDEAMQTDPNNPDPLWYECNDQDFSDELNEMLRVIEQPSIFRSQIWHTAALGNNLEKIDYAKGEGIIGLSHIHPADIRRYWLQRNRKCIGYKWRGNDPDHSSVWIGADNETPLDHVQIGSGQSTEKLWYPWDIMHMRHMCFMRSTEHGEPVFAEAEGIYKKLRLAIDQMVVHRAQVQPDRYVVNIDVQELPPFEQSKIVQRWRQSLRSKLSFGTGGNPGLNEVGDFSSFYNAMSLDTVLYVARPKGFQHGIEKLAGTASVPDIYDIEMLINLFYAVIGMPQGWFQQRVRAGESSNAPSGKALLAQDMRFLRKVKSLRNPVIQSYQWLGYLHAVLKGRDPSQLEIEAKMPPIGGLEEQVKLELLKNQADVLVTLGDVMEKFGLPKEAWIDIVFRKYMHLPDDVVNVFLTALPTEAEPEGAGGPGMMDSTINRLVSPAPTTAKLLSEIDKRLGKDKKMLVNNLREALNGRRPVPTNQRKFKSIKEVLSWGASQLRDSDVIVNSFGTDPLRFKAGGQALTVKPPVIQEASQPDEPVYRKFLRL